MDVEAAPDEAAEAEADDDQGLPRRVMDDGEGAAGRAPEVRVDEEVHDPDYGSAEAPGQDTVASTVQEEAENQPGSRQRPVPDALDDGLVRENAVGEGPVEVRLQSTSTTRPASRERRSEDVGQVARSLAYMTSLVTTLVGRMDRVEQAQSRNGSSASGRRTTTATSARMETPMGGTPEAGAVGWVDLNSLGERMANMSVAEVGPSERPLATLDSIFAGTFSSDDSETARLRAAQDGQVRGVPGALLGPLAEPLGPVMLAGNPCGVSLGQLRDESAGSSLALRPLQSMSLGYPLQAPPLQSMSQGSTMQAMQSSGMSSGSTMQAMQSSGMPSGSTMQAMQSSGMPLGSTMQAMQSPGMPVGSSAQAVQSSGMPSRSRAVPRSGMLLGSSGDVQGTVEQTRELALRPGLTNGVGTDGDLGETPFQSTTSEAVPAIEDAGGPPPLPPGLEGRRGQGLVLGAPATGLVFAEGSWRPYIMVQGQMVIQAVEPSSASAVGLSLAAPTYHPTAAAGTGGSSAATTRGILREKTMVHDLFEIAKVKAGGERRI